MITSDVKILTSTPPEQASLFKLNTDEFAVNVISTVGKKIKCARCWHRRSDVGKNLKHVDLCLRCVENLPDGKGEQRIYA